MSSVILHIGYSKAGSTFLKEWFTQHPGIRLGGFKDYDSLSSYVENTDKSGRNQQFVLSNHIFNLFQWNFNEPLDKWMKKPDLFEYQSKMSDVLYDLFPKAKVFFVTRGFESVLKSFYSEYVRTGGLLSFSEMLEEYHVNFFSKVYNYDYLINLYVEKYGKESVVVLPYELLKEDENEFLIKLQNLLQVDCGEFTIEHVNPSLEHKVLSSHIVISKFTYKLSRCFGAKSGDKVYGLYMRWLLAGKFNLVIKALNKLQKESDKLRVPDQMLRKFKGSAQILKSFPNYKKYHSNYLIDLETSD